MPRYLVYVSIACYLVAKISTIMRNCCIKNKVNIIYSFIPAWIFIIIMCFTFYLDLINPLSAFGVILNNAYPIEILTFIFTVVGLFTIIIQEYKDFFEKIKKLKGSLKDNLIFFIVIVFIIVVVIDIVNLLKFSFTTGYDFFVKNASVYDDFYIKKERVTVTTSSIGNHYYVNMIDRYKSSFYSDLVTYEEYQSAKNNGTVDLFIVWGDGNIVYSDIHDSKAVKFIDDVKLFNIRKLAAIIMSPIIVIIFLLINIKFYLISTKRLKENYYNV